MNQMQIKLLKTRLQDIADRKLAFLQKGHYEANSRLKELSHDQKLDLIFSGKAKLLSRKAFDNRTYRSNYLVDAFEFPADLDLAKKKLLLKDRLEEAKAVLEREKIRLVDQVVFTDAPDVIEMLAKFEAFVV